MNLEGDKNATNYSSFVKYGELFLFHNFNYCCIILSR